MTTTVSSGELAALGANSASASFVLAEGFGDIASLRSSGYGIVPLSQMSSQTDSNNATSPSYGGVRLRGFGVGADNSTFDVRIWAYTPSGSKGYLTLIGVASFTLGTLLGSAGSAIGPANRIADSVTFTLASASTSPTGPWADIYASLVASPAAYSPANNTSAFVILPELGSATYLVIDFDMTGATSGNVAVELLS